MLLRQIEQCRACGSDQIPVVLNLGDFALSDFLSSPDDHVDRAPLVLVRCAVCTLVQLRHTVDRDRLYRRYWYRSGTQPAMVSALRDVANDALSRVSLLPGDTVIDIGANDGTLLRMFPEGTYRIAFEPAENLWPLLQGTSRDPLQQISAVYGYFPTILSGEVVGLAPPGAKIITSIACFYDADDPKAFVQGIAKCLADDGVWINQLAYLPDTLAANNFGDICHEHLTYWTVEAFDNLLEGTGLYLNDYTFNDVNGGSVRLVVSKQPTKTIRRDAPSAMALRQFGWRVNKQAYDVVRSVMDLAGEDKTVIGYGASTKGNTYLQRWQIGLGVLEYIADRNPEKWGKYTPTGQKVISEAEMRAMKPDYLLVLPWHFLDAFVDRERDLLESGTKMIFPFPELRVLGGADAGLQSRGPSPGVLTKTI